MDLPLFSDEPDKTPLVETFLQSRPITASESVSEVGDIISLMLHTLLILVILSPFYYRHFWRFYNRVSK